MSMLPPKYNTLAKRRSKAKKKSKAVLEAERERDELLKKLGYKGKPGTRKRLKGAVPKDNAADNHRSPNISPTSDHIG